VFVKFSYIIPVYNSADCIVACLDGIYSLPFNEEGFEVIVVDDCSTDNTLETLNDYASKHSNMVVLHQEVNRRQGAARNKGIDIAKGEYIAFCDADDAIVTTGVMNALQAVEKSKADICYFDFEYEQPSGKWDLFKMPKETHNTIMSSTEYMEKYYTCWYNAPWRCLYRREFLQSTCVRFVEGVRWEDCDWTVKVYAQAQSIQFVDGIGYRYAFNESSTSKLRTVEAMSERVFAGLRLMNFGEEIKSSLPTLSHVVSDEGRYRYVIDTIRLRNLTKYSFREVKDLYVHMGVERRVDLSHYSWPRWETIFLKYRPIALFVLSIACPMASLGRKIVGQKRLLLKE
jgi:glycosyltransferase involved in cell wall biosynthesis